MLLLLAAAGVLFFWRGGKSGTGEFTNFYDLSEQKLFAAPRNATDKTLAGIWQDLMGIAGIGIDDDFFELGGHSLLAIQVLGRANAAFGVKVTLQELFSAPTVAGLSARIEALSSRRGPEYGKLAELAENLEQTSEEDIRRIVAESRASGTQV